MFWFPSKEAKFWMASKNTFLSYPSSSFWQETKIGWGSVHVSLYQFLSNYAIVTVLLWSSKTQCKKGVLILNYLNSIHQYLSSVLVTSHSDGHVSTSQSLMFFRMTNIHVAKEVLLYILQAVQSDWSQENSGRTQTEFNTVIGKFLTPWMILLQSKPGFTNFTQYLTLRAEILQAFKY